ncbi:hypothetical protein AQUCO_00500460v1 [Aquilegia coerulea]|uniref:AT-hook motif nuclear-localized protein n=1 Tax=Aquilegia coerulea TaxID=218851 RepID=A0A2G5ES46_AQUCA|nr:hypothetical protein AQUCO_00500460v1 [Aquilegia coerulea]
MACNSGKELLKSTPRKRRSTAWGMCEICNKYIEGIESHLEKNHRIGDGFQAIFQNSVEGFMGSEDGVRFLGNQLEISADYMTLDEDNSYKDWSDELKGAITSCIRESIIQTNRSELVEKKKNKNTKKSKKKICFENKSIWVDKCIKLYSVSRKALLAFYYQDYYPMLLLERRILNGDYNSSDEDSSYREWSDEFKEAISNCIIESIKQTNNSELGEKKKNNNNLIKEPIWVDKCLKLYSVSRKALLAFYYQEFYPMFLLERQILNGDKNGGLDPEDDGLEDDNLAVEDGRSLRNNFLTEFRDLGKDKFGENNLLEGLSSFSIRRARTPRRHMSLGGQRPFSSLGGGFTPYVIIVNRGEEVLGKILSVHQLGSWSACILSANGSLCSASVQHPRSSVCTIYEGCFEIITLSGALIYTEYNGSRCRVSVSMSGINGQMYGGKVVGPLMPAGRIQVVLGIFTSMRPADYSLPSLSRLDDD